MLSLILFGIEKKMCVCRNMQSFFRNCIMNAEELRQLPPEERCFILLGLPPLASREEISNRYKQLSLQYHPDRGGDHKKFMLVTKSYARCLQEVSKREQAQKGNLPILPHERRVDTKQAQLDDPLEGRCHVSIDPNNFNQDAFHRAFESFHVKEEWQRGYDVADSGVREEQPAVFMHPAVQARGTAGLDDAFREEQREHAKKYGKELMTYTDPQPIGLGTSLCAFTLGGEIHDFSDPTHGMTDYERAHTMYSKQCLSDSVVFEERPIPTLDKVRADRETIRPFDENERAHWESLRDREQQEELERQRRMEQYDADVQKRFENVHRFLVTSKKSSP
jgi:curved DNA-binding protein CbpA